MYLMAANRSPTPSLALPRRSDGGNTSSPRRSGGAIGGPAFLRGGGQP